MILTYLISIQNYCQVFSLNLQVHKQRKHQRDEKINRGRQIEEENRPNDETRNSNANSEASAARRDKLNEYLTRSGATCLQKVTFSTHKLACVHFVQKPTDQEKFLVVCTIFALQKN